MMVQRDHLERAGSRVGEHAGGVLDLRVPQGAALVLPGRTELRPQTTTRSERYTGSRSGQWRSNSSKVFVSRRAASAGCRGFPG